ncbi:NAD(P)-dependent oxidoreductase [Desertihabitans brevis]|uniref:NAD(P)-dependent oxidoreductase n=1 Tax=Desertihabitans brevis TaxID=2268447 RepID=A0A367YZE7_9ACTN|nr:NAD(P)-dependent oxidoreductase [Desertihabitans brevis]RCK71198.1 NAD(P)-dependent oxidoreductase [Desertihabitans brevis]
MSEETVQSERPVVGFIGLGDQGLPMARAIAEGGFALRVWARRPASLDALGDLPFTAVAAPVDLAAASDIVAVCVGTDDDVLALAGQMAPALRPGTVFVNHGTGTPRNAVRVADLLADRGVGVLDAPVSGGRPAAEERRLTALVGGPADALAVAEPVLRAFARHVVHLGDAGAGQMAKLFNNALLMMNQAGIADILELAAQAGLAPAALAEALKLGSASSTALGLMNTMITAETVDHLSQVQALDMDIFAQAMREANADEDAARRATERGLSGTLRLAEVIRTIAESRRAELPRG